VCGLWAFADPPDRQYYLDVFCVTYGVGKPAQMEHTYRTSVMLHESYRHFPSVFLDDKMVGVAFTSPTIRVIAVEMKTNERFRFHVPEPEVRFIFTLLFKVFVLTRLL
jgi:hypothetical protein